MRVRRSLGVLAGVAVIAAPLVSASTASANPLGDLARTTPLIGGQMGALFDGLPGLTAKVTATLKRGKVTSLHRVTR